MISFQYELNTCTTSHLWFRSDSAACILGDPGAASWDDGIFTGESLQQERKSPWAFTLTERVPVAFEIPPSDCFSGQSASGISNASGTRSVRVNAQGLSCSCCKLSPVNIPSPQLAANLGLQGCAACT